MILQYLVRCEYTLLFEVTVNSVNTVYIQWNGKLRIRLGKSEFTIEKSFFDLPTL